MLEAQLRAANFREWIWIPILIILSFLAFSFKNYRWEIKHYFLSILSDRAFNELHRDESDTTRKAGISLNVFFYFSLALFLFFLIPALQIGIKANFTFYLYLNGLIILGLLIKNLTTRTFGFIFKVQDCAKIYNYNALLSNKIVGIILFPFSIIAIYSTFFSKYSMALSLLFIALIQAFRIIKGLKLALSFSNIPKIYPFLYICSLEILPSAVLLKFIWRPLRAYLLS